MSRIVISFIPNQKQDKNLAMFLEKYFKGKNQNVTLVHQKVLEKDWINEIGIQSRSADSLIILLSKESVQNKKIQQRIKLANELFKQFKKGSVILLIHGNYQNESLPSPIESFDQQQHVFWNESDSYQTVSERILKTIKEFKNQKTKRFIGHFFKVFGIALAIFNFAIGITLSLTLIDAGDFIKTYGGLAFVYIWGVLPLLISILFSILIYGDDLIDDKTRIKKLRISTSLLIASLLILLGYLSYNDSHKSDLTITSENSIYKIKIESRTNNKIYYDSSPKKVGDSKNYLLGKRLPFDDYNIVVFFTLDQSQFLTRTFKERKETLVLF